MDRAGSEEGLPSVFLAVSFLPWSAEKAFSTQQEVAPELRS